MTTTFPAIVVGLVRHRSAFMVVFDETLTALERQLDPSQSLRVHRGHIVNLNRVTRGRAIIGGVYELELKGGATVHTGRQYTEVIRNLLKAPR